MARFIGRRLVYLLPVLLAITLLTFLIASLLPPLALFERFGHGY